MKIIFFGTPYFAATILNGLINEGNEIDAVVTNPDKKSGRGNKVKFSEVKEIALENKINVIQPLSLKDDSFIEHLKFINADLFIVIAFRMLPEKVWKLPKKGTINLHTSLLPNYRGAAPINWVLINGEKETGLTIFYIDKNIDSGSVIVKEKFYLTSSITAAELHNFLMHKGCDLMHRTIQKLKENNISGIIQNESSDNNIAPKITKELSKINWQKNAEQINNLIRGLSPFLSKDNLLRNVSICPSAWFYLHTGTTTKKRIKIHLSKVIYTTSDNFLSIQTDNKTYLNIVTKKNALSLEYLQPEGKKSMSIKQFLQGNKINSNSSVS